MASTTPRFITVESNSENIENSPFNSNPSALLQLKRDIFIESGISGQVYKNLIKYTRLQFKICNFIHSIYFQLDERNRFVLMKNKYRLALVKLNVFIHWSYFFCTGIYFFSTIRYNFMSEKLLAYAFFASWGVCALMQTEFWRHRSDAMFLFRSILEFEEKYLPEATEKHPQKKDAMTAILMVLGIISSFGLPGMMLVMLLADPCRPPHLGYILFKHGLGKCIVPSISIQIPVLCMDIYLWTIALPHGFFYVFQTLGVGVRCLDLYQRMLRAGLKSSKKRNDCNWDATCIKIYQELQLINKLFNIVFQPVFFPGVIAVGIFVAIMGWFAVFKLRDVIPFPAILFFPNIACDGLSIIFIAKMGALVYVQSKGFLQECKKKKSNEGGMVGGRRAKELKLLKAIDKLKIKFGGNFVDERTPLVFLDFCFAQTVSLMLLSGK